METLSRENERNEEGSVPALLPPPSGMERVANRTRCLLQSTAPGGEYYAALLAETRAGCGELCADDRLWREPLEGAADSDLTVTRYFDYSRHAGGTMASPPGNAGAHEGGVPWPSQRRAAQAQI